MSVNWYIFSRKHRLSARLRHIERPNRRRLWFVGLSHGIPDEQLVAGPHQRPHRHPFGLHLHVTHSMLRHSLHLHSHIPGHCSFGRYRHLSSSVPDQPRHRQPFRHRRYHNRSCYLLCVSLHHCPDHLLLQKKNISGHQHRQSRRQFRLQTLSNSFTPRRSLPGYGPLPGSVDPPSSRFLLPRSSLHRSSPVPLRPLPHHPLDPSSIRVPHSLPAVDYHVPDIDQHFHHRRLCHQLVLQ